MRRILFTGPRKLTVPQGEKVWETAKRYLPENFWENCLWILGDAPGVDTMLVNLARQSTCHYSRIMLNPDLKSNFNSPGEKSRALPQGSVVWESRALFV